MSMKRNAFITIGTAILVAAGASALVSAQAPPTVHGRMTLSMSNGKCVKTLAGNDGGDRIKAKRGGVVQWDVTNNCSADAAVAVGDFIRKGGGADDPFVAGRTNCSAVPGKGCMITLHVKGEAGIRTYSYAVSINGTKQDPDLIIEGV
jgi:hypothetical protein